MSKLAGMALEWAVLHPRVAMRARSVLRRDYGYKVHFKDIYSVVYTGNVYRSFKSYGPASSNAHLVLAGLIEALGQQGFEPDFVVDLVYDSYLQFAPASVAAGMSGRRTDEAVRAEGSSTAGQLQALGDRVDETVRANQNDEAIYKLTSLRFPKFFSDQVNDIHQRWSSISSVIVSLGASDSPATSLQTWTESDFHALSGATPDALGALGELAEAFGGPETAAAYYSRAIDSGIAPGGYWRVREVQCRSNWSRDQQVSYLRESYSHPWARAAADQLQAGKSPDDDWMLEWNPLSPSERSHRTMTEVRLALASGDWATAEAGGRSLWEQTDLPEAGLLAVDAMLGRELDAGNNGNSNELASALRLALNIRDRCRELRLPSGRAVSVAMHVSLLLGDGARSRSLGLTRPAGEALVEEAESEPVVRQRAFQAARSGQIGEALRLIPRIESESHREDARALLEEALGHENAAVLRWFFALSADTDTRHQSMLLWHLAIRGIEHPLVVKIGTLDADLADDLRLSALLVRDPDHAIPKARVEALSNRRIAFSLLQFFSRTGRTMDAERLAVAAAQRFADADLWLTGAEMALTAGRDEEARSHAEQAMAASPAGWGAMGRALIVKINAASRTGDWDAAVRTAEQLHKQDPSNAAAAWAVVLTRFQAGEVEGSFAGWRDAGRPGPIDRNHAAVWLELRRRIGPEVGSVQDAIRFTSNWPRDEQLRAALVITFMAEKLSDDDVVALQSAFSHYWLDFPDGGSMKKVAIDTENVLESLNEAFGPAPAPNDLGLRISRGELPLGMLSSVSSRTYAETLVLWGNAPRHSASSSNLSQEVEFVETSTRDGVVADLSALYALSVLDDEISYALFGAFSSVTVTSAQFRDASDGEYAVRTLSGLSMAPAGQNGTYIPVSTPESDLHRAKKRAKRLREWANASSRASVTEVRAMSELAGGGLAHDAWLIGLDYSVDTRRPFWCDDAVLRALARAQGIPTFGTGAVLKWYAARSTTANDVADLGFAQLMSAGFVGVPFTRKSFLLGLQLDGHEPRGTSQGLRFALAIENDEIQARLSGLINSVSLSSSDPEAIQKWSFVLGDWMVGLAGAPDTAGQNLQILLGVLLRQPWLNATTLPFLLRGFSAATNLHDMADSYLIEALAERYRLELISMKPELAFAWLSGLCGQIDPDMRSRLIARVLRSS